MINNEHVWPGPRLIRPEVELPKQTKPAKLSYKTAKTAKAVYSQTTSIQA